MRPSPIRDLGRLGNSLPRDHEAALRGGTPASSCLGAAAPSAGDSGRGFGTRLYDHDVLRLHAPLGLRGRSMAMLSLEKINKSYRSGASALHVLRDVDLEIASGDFVAIMGSSGSGKSTLLNVIGILDRYDSGAYHLDGHLVRDLSEREAARYRNRFIGFVFQAFNLLPFKSALENVALPLYYRGMRRRERNQRALDYLGRVGLRERAHHLPTELSGGECQRVAVARALITEPKLLLADEPTGALDTHTSYQLMELFQALNREGLTILIVTHEHDIAERAHRTILFRDGRIVATGV
jgi:putative ABC transport system ATP-binding protein